MHVSVVRASRRSLSDDLWLLSLRGRAHLEELDGGFVVGRYPNLLPAIFVKVTESQAANRALRVVKDLIVVLKGILVSSWVKNVGGVIAVSSHKNVSTLFGVITIWVDSVCEAWSHVGHGDREGIVEVRCDSLTSPIIVHWIFWELVCPDAILLVFRLVIVDK